MATQAQIDANRRNAQKSTGPTSAAGKAVASRNSTTHGLWSKDGVIADEDQALFDAFRSQLLDELKPRGVQQEQTAERIVHLWWKIRRVPRLERAAVDRLIAERPDQDQPADAAAVMVADLSQPRSLLRSLHSQEMRLTTAVRTALKELHELQAAAEEQESRDLLDELDALDGDDDEPPVRRNEPNSVATASPARTSAPPKPAFQAPVRRPEVARALASAVSSALGRTNAAVAGG